MLKETSKQDLIHQLHLLLDEYNINTEVMEFIEQEFFKRNILEARQITSKLVPLETMSDNILFLLLQFFHDKLQLEKYNPERYFTEMEIKDYKNYKRKSKDEVKFPIIFENVVKLADNQYSTTATIDQIASWYDNNLITYNFDTQRQATYIQKGDGEYIKKPTVNWDSVEDIASDVQNGSFFSNYITINILANGEDELLYDDNKNVLMIKSGEIDILDGFHRSLGFLKAYHTTKGIEFRTGLMVTNFDISKANAFIRQEDKRNKIDERHIKAMNDENLANDIVKSLNSHNKSDLKGKILTDVNVVNRHGGYTLTDTLADSIETLYKDKLKTQRDKRVLEEYLREFYNEVVGINYKDFENLKASREESLVTDKNMFIVYTCISKILIDNETWRYDLESLLSKLDFNKNNPIWKELKIAGNIKINTKNLNKIIKYLEGVR